MSVQALSWVFDNSSTTGSDRLVLLSIANHAGHVVGDDGEPVWEAWPSVALIAREAGLRRDQTARDALRRLVEGGHLERVIRAAPDGRIRGDRRTNLYRVLRPHETPRDVMSNDPTRNVGARDASGDPNDPTGNAPTTPRETRDDPTRAVGGTVIEPSPEPSTDRAPTSSARQLDHQRLPKDVDPEQVETLLALLAERVERHRGRRPKVTAAWWTEMGALLNSGAPGWEIPAPSFDEVVAVIDGVFARLAVRNERGFCWADQVRSPQGLRHKWEALTYALRRAGPTAPDNDAVLAAMRRLDDMGVGRG